MLLLNYHDRFSPRRGGKNAVLPVLQHLGQHFASLLATLHDQDRLGITAPGLGRRFSTAVQGLRGIKRPIRGRDAGESKILDGLQRLQIVHWVGRKRAHNDSSNNDCIKSIVCSTRLDNADKHVRTPSLFFEIAWAVSCDVTSATAVIE